MAVVCPIGVVYYFKEENSGKKFLIFVSIFIVLAAIMCTKVRAAWSAVLISFLTIAIIGYLRGQVSAKRVLAAFLIGAIFLVSTGPLIVHRFAVGTYGELRLPLMYTAMNMFQDHWLLGVGVNNYAFLLEQYVPRIYLDAWLYTVHNEYALRLAETGIVGAFLYYTLNILVMAKLFRATRSLDPLIFSVSLGLFAFLVGSIFHRFFSFYHFQPLYMLLSVVFAVTVIIPNLEKQRPADA
jgi:O-antigen ligase